MVRTTDNAAVITRRTRNLERNRVAATKCRRRKNQWQAGLESKKSELESRFRALRGETEALAEEVAQLKHLVMAHAFCNDANIDGWIQNQADNLPRSRTLSEVLPPALAPQPSPSPDTSEEEEEDWPIFGMRLQENISY